MIPTTKYIIHKIGFLRLVPVEQEDRESAEKLISENGLPLDGLNDTELYGLYHANRLIGTVGLEVFDQCAILRSLVIASGYRRMGLGRKLVKKMISRAKMIGVRQLFTLTESADRLMVKMNFLPRKRQNTPRCILPSKQTDLPACSDANLYERELPPFWVPNPIR